jgi:hypothetical protein
MALALERRATRTSSLAGRPMGGIVRAALIVLCLPALLLVWAVFVLIRVIDPNRSRHFTLRRP